MLDGVYRCGTDGAPIFVEVAPPTDDELHALLQTVITRLIKLLTRRGALVEDVGQTYLAEPDADGEEARTLRPLQAAAITYRMAFRPRAGHKLSALRAQCCERLQRDSPCAPTSTASAFTRRCGPMPRPAGGWSSCAATSPGRRCRTSGQVEPKLKTPWRDGTTHLVMSPLQFMQRLVALVPRSSLHRTDRPDSGRS